MARRPRIPNQKKIYDRLEMRTMRYLRLIRAIYEAHAREAAKIALATDYDRSGGVPFSFADYPQTRYAVERLQISFASSLQSAVISGVDAEWENADLAHEQFVGILRKRMRGKMTEERLNERFAKRYSNRSGALTAFKKRSDRGLTLSGRIWKQSEDWRRGVETALSVGIEKGMSAVTLSKRVSRFLNDFVEMKENYREMFGRAVKVSDCEFNSQRLARTEINMAYRTAEQERWRGEDYIVGYEVKRGRRKKNDKGEVEDYPCPVCGMLKGRYPKDFKFVGWHPMCRCYVVPILKTDEEFWNDVKGEESENFVKDVPDGFKQWLVENQDRIKKAHGTSHEPYFVKDNWEKIKTKLNPKKIRIETIKEESFSLRKYTFENDKISQKEILINKNSFKPTAKTIDPYYHNLHNNVLTIENNIRTSDVEINYLIDKNGNIISKIIGNENYVDLKSTEGLTKDCITIHNHPSGWHYKKDSLAHIGNSFGSSDLWYAINGDVAETRIVTPIYTFSFKRPKDGWNIKDKQLFYQLLQKATIQSEFECKQKMSLLNGVEFEKQRMENIAFLLHNINIIFAELIGAQYEIKKTVL